MIYLITGINGFLGTFFRKNLFSSKLSFIYGTTSFTYDEKTIQFGDLYHDINEKLSSIKIDGIIHLASIIPKNFQETDFELFNKNNQMMNNLYTFALKNKIKKFIYISSFGSMNDPSNLDIKDYYTFSKITGEHFCSMMRARNIQSIVFRISAPYGEYSKSKNVINIFIEKAINNINLPILGTGSREQNFTYVGDILNAVILAVNNNINDVYNIVGSGNISMLNLAKLIIKITNSKSQIDFTNKIDPQEFYRPNYSNKKAELDFGYKPMYSLESGLTKYINWYKQQ